MREIPLVRRTAVLSVRLLVCMYVCKDDHIRLTILFQWFWYTLHRQRTHFLTNIHIHTHTHEKVVAHTHTHIYWRLLMVSIGKQPNLLRTPNQQPLLEEGNECTTYSSQHSAFATSYMYVHTHINTHTQTHLCTLSTGLVKLTLAGSALICLPQNRRAVSPLP